MRYVKKIFSDFNESIEKKVNDWVQKHQVKIVDFKYRTYEYTEAMIILYEAEQPVIDDEEEEVTEEQLLEDLQKLREERRNANR